MDGLLEQLFPKGKERWIKVLYTDPKKAMNVIRLKSHNFNTDELGFEVTAIGCVDEHMPQVEALLQLKASLRKDPLSYNFPDVVLFMEGKIDNQIAKVMNEVVIKS